MIFADVYTARYILSCKGKTQQLQVSSYCVLALQSSFYAKYTLFTHLFQHYLTLKLLSFWVVLGRVSETQIQVDENLKFGGLRVGHTIGTE